MATVAGGKNRKHGRNKLFCQRYALEGREAKNKAAKLARHLKRVPWDDTARRAFEALPQLAQRGHPIPPKQAKPDSGIWRRLPTAMQPKHAAKAA